MNNSDLRIILLYINWELKSKYQQRICAIRKSGNVSHRVKTSFRKTSYNATPECKVEGVHR